MQNEISPLPHILTTTTIISKMPLFIFDVTHILKHVGLYLSRRDIMYCSLVSFEWSQVFRHLFWSNFEVGNIDYAQLLTQPGHQEILEKNAPTIQTLIVRYSPKIMPLLEYLQEAPEILNSKRLTRLVLKHDGKLQDQNEVMDVEVLIKLLSITGKNLEELDANMDLLTRLAPSEFRKLRDSFQGLGCLRNLEFKGENRYVVPLLGFVLRYCPESVESLVFDFPVSQQSHPIGHWGFVEPNPEVNPTTEDLIASFWEKATQTNIQRIQLPRFLNSHEKTTLIPFLKYRCQNLKEWKSVSMTRPNEIIVELNETINRFCPQLSNLEFKDILLENRFIYPQIIRGCQGLQSLTVTGKVRDARGVLKAIVESQRETIKMIRWRASGGFPGGDGIEGELDIENVLKKCRKLERLETTFEDTKCFYSGQVVGAIWIRDEEVEDDKEGKGDKESEGGKDDGDKGGEKDKEGGGDKEEKKKEGEKEMPKEQSDGQQLTNSRLYWGCRSTIVYLDITFYPAKHIIDKKRFKKRVEDTYKKLGQLEVLEELILGCSCHCYGHKLMRCQHYRFNGENGALDLRTASQGQGQGQDDEEEEAVILDMSLDTGLVHMAGLKRMKKLNIGRIQGHRIGYKELEWMRMNWISMKVLGGVRNNKIMDWIEREWKGVKVSYLNREMRIV